MKQRPILFSTPMVQATIRGRKTQTRRIFKPQPTEKHDQSGYITALGKDGINYFGFKENETNIFDAIECPYGQPGDVLWVRETFQQDGEDYLYKANCDINVVGWKPSIHMPKSAARIWLRIANVRVERLQDISREDARAEGIEPINNTQFINYVDGTTTYNERTSFYSLWESINGKESLSSNPWVWVIEFERIEKSE